ncbi:MAG TPA: hypothetical protein VE046_03780 [Steroidobacteraceae bacterium]|nr:hypothetical protein [Steroidobacteraceae bacterium]
MQLDSCMPVIPSADPEKSLRFWLNQRAGSPIKPENHEGIRLYWAPRDIHAIRDRLETLGYAVSKISDRA